MTAANNGEVQTLQRLLQIAEDIMMIVKTERSNRRTTPTTSLTSSEIVSRPPSTATTSSSSTTTRGENINRRWNPYQRNSRNSGISRTQHQESTSPRVSGTTRKNLNEMLLLAFERGNTAAAAPNAAPSSAVGCRGALRGGEQVQVNEGNNGVEARHMCAICLGQYLHNVPVVTTCGHVFCKTCIYAVIRRSARCPLCNRFLGLSSTFRIFL